MINCRERKLFDRDRNKKFIIEANLCPRFTYSDSTDAVMLIGLPHRQCNELKAESWRQRKKGEQCMYQHGKNY